MPMFSIGVTCGFVVVVVVVVVCLFFLFFSNWCRGESECESNDEKVFKISFVGRIF